jgi:phytoene dehydrogenase-like protein
MKTYDSIVAGSGASGLTAALLLALNGRKVLLLERGPRPGGSLVRFQLNGLHFDTGLHFTGGMGRDGLMRRMLDALGLRDAIRPVFLADGCAHRFVFDSCGRSFDLPAGISGWHSKLKEYFPGEGQAVDRYFDQVVGVREASAGMDLCRIADASGRIPQETVSLKTVVDKLTGNPLLKGVICGMGMCYGVKPSEVSFATHCRVCYDLYESSARLSGGGDSLIKAFLQAFRGLDVDVRCGAWIRELIDLSDSVAKRALLNTGELVEMGDVVLTMHPRQILDTLPRDTVSKAFSNRVNGFEASAGFFTVFGMMDGGAGEGLDGTIVSLFPHADFEQLLDPSYRGEQAVVICSTAERVTGRDCHAVTAFEPSFPEHVAAWRDSRVGHRPAAYAGYKAGRVEAIRRRIETYDGRFREHFKFLDAASVLTFRDYLNSPDGSAYGIKQKVGQFNLLGRLPVRNCFAAGQSALLPGVAGAMMSSFMAVRAIMGRDAFGRFVNGRLNS